MGNLGFQSLIGILEVRRRGKQLTPLSSDVFVSIPDRDSVPFLSEEVRLRQISSLSHSSPSSPDLFNWSNKSLTY